MEDPSAPGAGLVDGGTEDARAVLQERLEDAPSWWRVVVALMEAWLESSDALPPPTECDDDGLFEEWGKVTLLVEEVLTDRGPQPAETDLRSLIEQVGDGEAWRMHAAAWAVDAKCNPLFTDGWLAEHENAFTPVVDEPSPVCSWDGPDGWPYSRSPTHSVVSDELPHVRRYRPSLGVVEPVAYVFETAVEHDLAAALEGVTYVAGLHPNMEWDELDVPPGASVYPIRPKNPTVQAANILKGLSAACDAGAAVVVAPELSTTADIVDELRAWVSERDDYVLVVAGSVHEDDADGTPANIATTLLRDRALPTLRHRKIVPFTTGGMGGTKGREGIRPGPRCLNVLAAGNFRFATVICKDFLDGDIRAAIRRAGVNVLAVPSMSTSMDSYPAEASGYVLGSQGVAVVANNPSRNEEGDAIEPAAVFGQPVAGVESVQAPPREGQDRSFIAIFELGDKRARWLAEPKLVDR